MSWKWNLTISADNKYLDSKLIHAISSGAILIQEKPHMRIQINITKTCLYNFDLLKPHFYIVKLGFTGVYIIFLISAQNIDCGYSLEPPRDVFEQKYEKLSEFLSENFQFLEVKFSIYLNRSVFIMDSFWNPRCSIPLRKHAYSNIVKILPPKNEKFQIKNSYIFHIFAQNIDCGYLLELPCQGSSNEYPQSMFLSRSKKNNVYPCKPQFYYIKAGFKGVKII